MILARVQSPLSKKIEWLFGLLVLICGFCLMVDYLQRSSNDFGQKYGLSLVKRALSPSHDHLEFLHDPILEYHSNLGPELPTGMSDQG